MSKIKFFVSFIVFFNISNFFAQEEYNISSTWDSKMGAGGGVVFNIGTPNLKAFNSALEKLKVQKFENNFIFPFGGVGFAYLPIAKNFRIGGIGTGANVTKKGFSDGYEKETNIVFSNGGFTIEYSIPYIKTIAVSIGAVLGASSIEINIYKNNGTATWDDIWDPGFDSVSVSKAQYYKITSANFSITPTLNIDIPFEKFLCFRIGCGYVFTFENEWKLNNERSIYSVPTNIKSDNFFISFGLMAGFFVF